MAIWIPPSEVEIPAEFSEAVGGNPLVAQILYRRGYTQIDQALGFLDPRYYCPSPPTDLPGMEKSVDQLLIAIKEKKPIWVWGDFDVDGQTSTAILVSTLKALGGAVRFHIPVRAEESHGVNVKNLEPIIDSGAGLLLTCDTGISSHTAVDYAQSRGVPVVISDHHDLPPTLPNAAAIINPRLLPVEHPLSSLSGSGVAFKLAQALFDRSGRAGEEEQLLDLACLGIIADLADLKADTRYIAQLGIAALRTSPRKGLLNILELTETNPLHLTETHIGFLLAPRLNAQGRLDNANEMVEFLTTQDEGRARILANRLEGLNAQRKLLTRQVLKAAMAQVENNPALLSSPVLVLSHRTWPGGIIGIVASQLASRFNRPVVLINSPPGEPARGSARSIPGCDITQAIASCSHLLSGFGGHPMAAGFSLAPNNLAEFNLLLAKSVEEQIGSTPLSREISIDAWQPLEGLNLESVLEIERLAPFGPANPPVVLVDKNLTLVNRSTIGRDGDHLQMIVQDEAGCTHKALWWQGSLFPPPEGKFDLAYTPRASSYRAALDVQIEWIDTRVIEPPKIEPSLPRFSIHDYRTHSHPRAHLDGLLRDHPEIQVWAEATPQDWQIKSERWQIKPAPILVIWSAPPGLNELRQVVEKAQPEQIYVFGVVPATENPTTFLKTLSGIVKYILTHEKGQTSLLRLAAATAQRESAVKKGLAWLEARAFIQVEYLPEAGAIQIHPGSIPDLLMEQNSLKNIRAILEETRAFRQFFHNADLNSLLI